MCSVEFYYIFFFSNGNVSIVFRYFITEKYTKKQKVRRLDARGHRYYRRNNNQKNLIIRAENIFRIIEKPDRIVRSVWVFHEIVKYRFFHFFFFPISYLIITLQLCFIGARRRHGRENCCDDHDTGNELVTRYWLSDK